MATVLSMKGDFTKADQILTEIISTAEQSSCEHLSTFLVNKGVNKILSGVGKSALDDCQLAKNIAFAAGMTEVVEEADDCITKAKMLFS